MFEELLGEAPPQEVGFVGLRAGTLAAYGRPGQRFTYYEIDPAAIRIARYPRFLTYLADSKATIETVPGDGLLSPARKPDGKFGLLVLDAFSSDAIPAHLLTREAVALQFKKLSPRGIRAVHLTNQYPSRKQVMGGIGASLGLVARVRTDRVARPQEA